MSIAPRSAESLLHALPSPVRFGKVAVIFGGRSAEREISLMSGQGVLDALRSAGVDAHPFDPRDHALSELRTEGYARAFLMLHGQQGEDGVVQGALDVLNIPYTGCGVMASALGMDKLRCKWLWRGMGLPVPDFALLDANSDWAAIEAHLGLPLFVKPAREGSSLGVVKVKQSGTLRTAWEEAARYDTLVLAETALGGGEYTIPVLAPMQPACAEDCTALPVIHIEPATEFYDYQAKYFRDDTRYHCPAPLSATQTARCQDLARRAFWAIGGGGWGRIDLLLDAAGEPHLLEANTAPGMTSHSLVPMSARAWGLSYQQLVLSILGQTLSNP